MIDSIENPTAPSHTPSASDEPCLPGFEPQPLDPSPLRSEPAPDRTASSAPESAPRRLHRFALLAALTICVGIFSGLLVRILWPRIVVREVVREVTVEPDGFPLALLVDADVWPIVASMSGSVGGVRLSFDKGLARVGKFEYRVCPDFCRHGSDCYVRLEGNGSWIVRVAPDGKILKAFPAPKNHLPLKVLLAGL